MHNEQDIVYMRRCLQLAANGLGRVRPNPMVGCVVVKDGRIVSEGYHQYYGGYHAERNALLRPLPLEVFRGATLYVNLEPCSHYGKTPPCADLVVERGIRRVVCCNDDPNPLVAGNGFRKLEEAGIEAVAPLETPRGTFVAPFVNAEKAQYLVVEDKFPNGRPPLEKAGVYFTDRETVNKTERMKVTTCLNP
ncbi:MAG: bifunctional diaminohydroxyphosphoribosylaminopyrimidine deaminase/5-amino-6-(5-phosphoribosylamino)uracil reductase RibD, partial [Bacteroidales bacterium]|nr:bifunctional diaminohydroxyphosphoribosylaminopyrimidine deaminase/5-amino-6-(5-phosphoribosylamino)uracil reductase RibD [Bacteroidales bacterium]